MASVNAMNASGDTTLHLLAASGNAAGVELLLQCGADANVRGRGGRAPLHAACEPRGDDGAQDEVADAARAACVVKLLSAGFSRPASA